MTLAVLARCGVLCVAAAIVQTSPGAADRGNPTTVAHVALTLLLSIPGHPLTLPLGLGWSPDGRYLAIAKRDGYVSCWDTRSGRQQWALGSDALHDLGVRGAHHPVTNAWFVSAHPRDGAFALSNAVGELVLVDAVTGVTSRRYASSRWVCSNLAWSPGGDLLAAVEGPGTIRFRDPDLSNSFDIRLPEEAAPIAGLRWDMNGERLAVASVGSGEWSGLRNGLLIINRRERRIERALVSGEGEFQAFDWCGPGDLLASGGSKGRVAFWNAATGRRIASGPAPDPEVWSIRWQPRRRLLAVGGEEERQGHVELWWVNHSGVPARAARTEVPGGVWRLEWSLDGSRLAVALLDGQVQVWKVSDAAAP